MSYTGDHECKKLIVCLFFDPARGLVFATEVIQYPRSGVPATCDLNVDTMALVVAAFDRYESPKSGFVCPPYQSK